MPGRKKKVDLGKHVEIELVDPEGEVERMAFDLVPDEQADFYSGLLASTRRWRKRSWANA
jgi:hypothetical protein